jgi:recombination protein RecR
MSAVLLPEVLEDLINELAKLPGIGRKTASRLAFYILETDKEEAISLAKTIINLREKIGFCSVCYNLSEEELCGICKDPSRNQKLLCVVEDVTSLMMIERTNEFNGLYHVLGGVISPLDGVSAKELNIDELHSRAKQADEVVLALNPSTEGEATSIYISRLLKPFDVRVTRLARGIPLGGHLEFVDELTLSKALKSRLDI